MGLQALTFYVPKPDEVNAMITTCDIDDNDIICVTKEHYPVCCRIYFNIAAQKPKRMS